MSSISIVELSSRDVRETVLKKLQQDKTTLKEDDGVGEVSFNRAKTTWQLNCNGNLKKAMDLLKKDSRCKGKSVDISWQEDGTKDRVVKVDNRIALCQTKTD